MVSNKIKIELRGNKTDKELIRFSDFVAALSGINHILSGLDHDITNTNIPSLYFRVTNLRCLSPAIIEAEAVPIDPAIDHSVEIVNKFLIGLDSIKQGKAPAELDSGVLRLYKNIGGVFSKNITEMVFSSEDTQINLNEDIEAKIEEILGEDEIIEGSVSGILEYINIHAGANRFIIYPIAGPKRIDCHFPHSLLKSAITGLDHRVNVRGRLKYKRRDSFPYAIDIDDIEIYPDESELTNLLDLRGIAPNATGDLSSEEFISSIRHDE